MDAPVRVACIQAEPVVLDREGTIDELDRLAAKAAGQGDGAHRPDVPVPTVTPN